MRAVLAGTLLFALVSPARAFKWYECPAPPVPVHPSTLGASSSPFIHPGHELTILLNDQEVAATGGFGLGPEGNEIAITFASLFGAPVELSARAVSAPSPAVLTFDFPDTLEEVGRTLAGPVEVVVSTAGVETARIAASDLVGLPAAADLTSILLGDAADQIAHAAVGVDGDLWLPASFAGKHMGMPGCEGNFIMPAPIEIGGAAILGTVLFPFDPTTRIRAIEGYLGDMVINGTSFYGFLYPEQIQLVQVGNTLGVSVCRLNDAEDLVLRVKGDPSWAQPRSPFRLVALESAPLALLLRKGPPVPLSTSAVERSRSLDGPGRIDSFGNQCEEVRAPRGNLTTLDDAHASRAFVSPADPAARLPGSPR
jgi:hypothetical protein